MVKVIAPSVEILTPLDGDSILKHIELCARNCYKSEDKITDDSARKMVKKLIEMGHEAMIEHFNITVRLITDIGVLKDLSRHRLVSFAVESTRYCMYSKDKFGSQLTVMEPPVLEKGTEAYNIWLKGMEDIEKAYNSLAAMGYKADVCRTLLPHGLKVEMIMTSNLREWRHIFKLRCAPAAHPTVQQVMKMLLREFKAKIPVVFDDIHWDEEEQPTLQKVAE